MSISGYANTVVTTQSISQSYFIKEIKKLTDSPYEFAKFKQNCNLIFSGPFVKKTENEQASFILLWIGKQGLETFNSWTRSDSEAKLNQAKP